MPATYTYKARDKAGKVITGSLMADNEGLVLNRLREMGHTPLEVGKQKKSMNLEINLHPGRVKLKVMSVFSRQFATMINAGLPILRAMAILADQTDNKELEEDPHAGSARRRTGVVALRGHAEAPRRIQQPVYRDGPLGRDRR